MELLFIILNDEEHVDNLLTELNDAGIRGGTILDSQGMVRTLVEHSLGSSYESLRTILSGGRPYNKTMFLLLDNERVEVAKSCVRKVVGDINRENIGIMFTVPVNSAEGLTK